MIGSFPNDGGVSPPWAATSGQIMGDLAYQRVLSALFDRTIQPGAVMSQRELVALLETPIQPLRDALTVLEAEGVVTIHPRAGIEFVKPDHALIHHTYQFRAIIERAAARRFAEIGDEDHIAALIAEHESARHVIEKGIFGESELKRMFALERVLHDGMTRALSNPMIETAARQLKNFVLLIRVDAVMTRPFALRVIEEHLAVLHACARRDAEGAELALTDHFGSSVARLTGKLRGL